MPMEGSLDPPNEPRRGAPLARDERLARSKRISKPSLDQDTRYNSGSDSTYVDSGISRTICSLSLHLPRTASNLGDWRLWSLAALTASPAAARLLLAYAGAWISKCAGSLLPFRTSSGLRVSGLKLDRYSVMASETICGSCDCDESVVAFFSTSNTSRLMLLAISTKNREFPVEYP